MEHSLHATVILTQGGSARPFLELPERDIHVHLDKSGSHSLNHSNDSYTKGPVRVAFGCDHRGKMPLSQEIVISWFAGPPRVMGVI